MQIGDYVVHIVDDEEPVRKSLAFLLTMAGFAVRVHESATSFLTAATAPGFGRACLVTDLRMPDMSGVDLLERLGTADAMVPAVVISGHGDVPMAVAAMKAGALDFIEKPFQDDVLIEAIQRAAERHLRNARQGRRRRRHPRRHAPLTIASGRCWPPWWPAFPTRPSPTTSTSARAPSRSTAPT